MTSDATKGLGFCPDLQPDFNVGMAMPGLLIASADVAYDLVSLQQHNVTHILNVAAALPNAFSNVSEATYVYMYMAGRGTFIMKE